MYDITDEDSFQKVKVWVKELRRMVGPDICLIIAGNKADLERCIKCRFTFVFLISSLSIVRKRVVDQDMAEKFAASVNAAHVYTSAKMNDGIEELFVKLTTNILRKHAKPDDAPRLLSFNFWMLIIPHTNFCRQNIRILDDHEAKSKSGCCSK